MFTKEETYHRRWLHTGSRQTTNLFFFVGGASEGERMRESGV